MSGMIFDRTDQDVLNALALRKKMQDGETLTADEIAAMERGFLSTATLNRVEAKIAEIYDRIEEMGYSCTEYPTKSWTPSAFFKREDFARLRSVAAALLADLGQFIKSDTPRKIDTRITLGFINNLEHFLSDFDDMAQNAQADYVYAAEIFSGEVTT